MAASYTFEDLSGSSTSVTGDNPYQDLIEACNNDPDQIKQRYEIQRTKRNDQKRAELLSPDFQGVNIDSILARLEDPSIEPGFEDWRHCLVFWARPPRHIRDLIHDIQRRLISVCQGLWTMKPPDLHMTVLEIAHSLTSEQIEALVHKIEPIVPEVTDFPYEHRARLVKPQLNYDTQSLALQFLPAVGEPGRSLEEDRYTYHHLRRDVFSKVKAAGMEIGSRYVTPSAHLTIARFITKQDFETINGDVDAQKVQEFVSKIDDINVWLRTEYWPTADDIANTGEWIVGQEKGLDCRKGTLWYGSGGRTVRLGKGF